MPRNAAGVYALPDPPRVPNTVIDSPDENITRDDIATELTNSLDRNGRGGMLAPFRIADGTLAAPGLAFLNEPGSGLWRPSAAVMQVSVQGAYVAQFTANGMTVPAGKTLTVSGTAVFADLKLSDGSAAAPSLSFINENNTGVFRGVGGGDFNIAVGGGNVFRVTATGVQSLKSLVSGSLGNDGSFTALRTVDGASALTMAYDSVGSRCVFNDHTNNRFSFFFGSVTEGVRIQYGGAGTNTLVITAGTPFPIISTTNGGIVQFSQGMSIPQGAGMYFDGGADTNIQSGAPDVLTFVTGGAQRLNLGNVNASFTTSISVLPTQPIYLDGAGDTWIYEQAANVIAFHAGGVDRLYIQPGVVLVAPLLQVTNGSAIYIEAGVNDSILRLGGNDYEWQVKRNYAANGAAGVGSFSIRYVQGAINMLTVERNGFTKMSSNGSLFAGAAANHFEMYKGLDEGNWVCVISHAGGVANAFGLKIAYPNANPNNSGNYFLYCEAPGIGQAMSVKSNGGINNFAGNNTNLSDAGVKDYIQPLAPLDLAKLWVAHRDVNWCSFKMRGQTHDDPNFGYLAQDIADKFANVAPWLVDEEDHGNPTDEYPTMRKVVYADDLHNIGHALLSEAQRRIEQLELEVAQLKGVH